jgi:TonB family protein
VLQSTRHYFEALGAQTVNGLYAEGYRETTLVRDESTGTDKTATTEQWLSPDLKIVVRRIETDQRSANENSPQGVVSRTELTDIGRSDPDPELFKLPMGYQAVDSFSGAPIVQTQDTTNIAPYGSKDKPVLVSSNVIAGLLLHKVDPAQDSGISGSVVMAAEIDDQGKITKLFVISGPEKLRDAALEAVNQWTYKPYLLNGKPVFVQTNITTNFNLAK